MTRFADDTFNTFWRTAIGVDFKVRTINCDGKIAKLQVCDTAGQERFHLENSSYYQNVHGMILCYDITNKESLKNIGY